MLKNENEVKKLVSSLVEYFKLEKEKTVVNVLELAVVSAEELDIRNSIVYYSLNFSLEIKDYFRYKSEIDYISEKIEEAANLFLQKSAFEEVQAVSIFPECRMYLNWDSLKGEADKKVLIDNIEAIKNMMTEVSVGQAQIKDLENEYNNLYMKTNIWLKKLGIENPNNYTNLWEWYGRWSQNDLDTYQKRRIFIIGLYKQLISIISEYPNESPLYEYEPTGWEKIDRSVYEMKKILLTASTEEQFQSIGLHARETLISIAQQVYVENIHGTLDGIIPSKTDFKRMIKAYISKELSGHDNEKTRKMATSAFDLANNLQHDRLATRRESIMCLASLIAVATIIKAVEDYREESSLPF